MIELYEPEVIPGLPPACDTWAQKFAAFHAAHPEVYDAFHAEAVKLLPCRTLHMRHIAEDLRSHLFILYGVRVNNNFLPFYADELEKDPRLAGKFKHRAKAKGKMALHYTR